MIVFSDLLIWLALAGAGTFAAVSSQRHREVEPSHGLLALLSIQLGIVAAFFVQPGIRNLHGFVAAMTSAVFSFAVFMWITQRDSAIKNQEWALGACITALWTFGSLFQSRMYWEPDPAASWNAVSLSDLWDHLLRSLLPLFMIVVGVVLLGVSEIRRRAVRASISIGHRIQTDPARLVAVVIALVVLGGFNGAARLSDPESHLEVGGLQVSEFTTPLWLMILVMIFVWWSNRFIRVRPAYTGRRQDLPWGLAIIALFVRQTLSWLGSWLRSWRIFLPLALFLAVLLASAWWRDDFGSLIAPALALVGMLLWTLQHYRERWRQATGDEHRFHWRTAVGTIVMLLLSAPLLILFSPAFGKLRGRAWLAPWSLPWHVECTPVTVPALEAQMPAGYSPCASLYTDLTLQQGSQMAKAQVIIDGGGLWGRGLANIEAGIVGAAHTDFVFASIWSKFGALTVALLVTLALVVAIVLFGLARRPGESMAARGTSITISALGMVFAGQTVFVLLANSNLVPHSGIPAPLLSYATQSTGFFLLLLWAALESTRRSLPDAPPPPGGSARLPRLAENHWPVALLASALVLSIFLGLVAPYRSLVPPGLTTGLRSDLAGVTEQVAAQRESRASVTVWIDGEPSLDFDKGSRRWTELPGRQTQSILADLTGLVRGQDNQARALDVAIGSLLAELPAANDNRFLPGAQETVRVDLALNLRLQRAAQQLVTDPSSDGLRYPMGLVILDPATGAILASASSPPPERAEGAADTTVVDDPKGVVDNGRFVPLTKQQCDSRDDCEKLRYGQLLDGQFLALSQSDCQEKKALCRVLEWRYAPEKEAADLDLLRSYAGGLSADQVDFPAVGQDRVMNRAYGPASVFKVIIAAAYLRSGGSISDRIPAPPQLVIGNRPITNNYQDSWCPLTHEDGTLTLEEALAVSCNTPFIWLAQQIGWPAIAEMANAFGFALDDGGDLNWPVASVVPSQVGQSELAVAALGGGEVVATPLQLASMLATVANQGIRHSPMMFTGIGGTDGSLRSLEDVGQQVLTPEEAAALQQALALTSQLGTMAGITDQPLAGKTGTMELDIADPRQYYGADLWYVGYAEVETTGQQLAFALVAEVPSDYTSAQQHVRHIVGSLCDEIAGVRR